LKLAVTETVMETNSNPIRVAAAEAAVVKKFSQP
jgi:hypothetical protein